MSFLNRVLHALALVASLASCKKEDEEGSVPAPPVAPLEVSAFSNLEVGNYWVYERRQVDSLDMDQGMPVRLDSLYVIGDTLLDGESLTMIRLGVNGQPGNGARYYWRDSADCVVDRYHRIQFRSTNLGQVFYTENTGGSAGLLIGYAVSSSNVLVPVPAGNFLAYLVLGQCASFGGFPVMPEWKFPRSYWSENVGRVKWYEYYASGWLGYRYDLVRYHVQ